MKLHYFAVVSAFALLGCPPPPTNSDGGNTDATTDTSTPSDATPGVDAATQDTSPPDTSAPDTSAPDTGGGGDAGNPYGVCGQGVHDCVCACDPSDQACQQACATPECQACAGMALQQCCPSESMALDACANATFVADDAGPARCAQGDYNCATGFCGMEYDAFSMCVSDGFGTGSPPRCQGFIDTCTGTQGNVCP